VKRRGDHLLNTLRTVTISDVDGSIRRPLSGASAEDLAIISQQPGLPWCAGREVWVYGMRGGRGKVIFRVARLHSQVALSKQELDALFAAWMGLGRTLTETETQSILFKAALTA
jgi:hypothetical protein